MDSSNFVKEFEEAEAAEREEDRQRAISRKRRKLTHSLMITTCVVTILFGLIARLAADSSAVEVDDKTSKEVRLAIDNIVETISKNKTQFSTSILASGDIITKNYAESLQKSAFVVLNCAEKINDNAKYKKMLDLGDNTVKVEIQADSGDTVKLLMADENGWKIDSANCKNVSSLVS